MAFKCPTCGVGTTFVEIIPNYSTKINGKSVYIKDMSMTKCTHCSETSMSSKEYGRCENIQKVWHVGFKDRGHGHGDFAVLDEAGTVIAEVKTELCQDAHLLAAAPDLVAFAESFMGNNCTCPPNHCGTCIKCRASVAISKSIGK